MRKLGFRFSAVPRDRHPAWFSLPILTRTVGHELYAASCAEDGCSRPIPVHGNWRTSLCRTLCIEPDDRAAISQCFSAMQRAGLVRVETDTVFVLWNPSEKLFEPPPASTGLEGGLPGADGGLSHPLPGADGGLSRRTPRNHSGRFAREEEIRVDKIRGERAREETDPSELSLGEEIRSGFDRRFVQATASSPNLVALGKALRTLVPWVEQTAELRKLSETEIVTRVLDGFFANDNAKTKRYPPSFLAQNPLEYLDPAPLKPIVRMKLVGPSEVSINPQDYAVPEGGPKW